MKRDVPLSPKNTASAPETDAQESYVPRELARERLEEYEAHAEQTRETHASSVAPDPMASCSACSASWPPH